jgi:hypothetical protein
MTAVAATLAAPAIHAAQPAKGKIKVGQIGVGHAHATKLEVYRRSDDYEVVGIVEPDKALRERAANVAAYRDLPWMNEEQLLAVDGLQVVTVETHVRDLLDTAGRCIAAGKHVHLDKPAGASLPEYRKLLDAAGKLTIYAIAIDRVPRRWRETQRDGEFTMEADDPRASAPRLIDKVELRP